MTSLGVFKNTKVLITGPLRGCEGVLFASTPEDLAAAWTSAGTAPRTPGDPQNFFTLDSELPRWRKLIMDSLA